MCASLGCVAHFKKRNNILNKAKNDKKSDKFLQNRRKNRLTIYKRAIFKNSKYSLLVIIF